MSNLPLGFTAARGTFQVPVLGSAPFAVQWLPDRQICCGKHEGKERASHRKGSRGITNPHHKPTETQNPQRPGQKSPQTRFQ